jgi:predicted exporter
VASTCIAYLTFLFSGVAGLEQLACFTVSGLAVAGLTTRFLLPPLLQSGGRDFGDSALLGRLWHAIARLPRPRAAYLLVIVACAAAIATARQPFWEDDLGKLTPVPEPLLARDQELRAQLGTADVRYLLVVAAADEADALARLEALDSALDGAVASGAIAAYDHAARYVPSAKTQQRRQAKLPDSSTLRAALEAAQRDGPFRSGVFDPFLADVERARALPPLTVDRVRDTPLGARIDLLLSHGTDGRTRALVTLSGVRDVGALQALAMAPGLTFLDLKSASETLVARERGRILLSLALAGVLLVAVVLVALRRRERVARVLAPMAVTTLLVVAVLQASGISLNLFHLISLVLVAGLGLDYALFFEHAADDPAEQRRTLHAVLVCSASTFMVFALLAISSLPVLRAIGLPVSIGVVSNFVLALLLTRPRPAAAR